MCKNKLYEIHPSISGKCFEYNFTSYKKEKVFFISDILKDRTSYQRVKKEIAKNMIHIFYSKTKDTWFYEGEEYRTIPFNADNIDKNILTLVWYNANIFKLRRVYDEKVLLECIYTKKVLWTKLKWIKQIENINNGK